jgi:hypothetical protein
VIDPHAHGWRVLQGPTREGSEIRWTVQLDDRVALLGQLAPELARDPVVRRRYVRDVDRWRKHAVRGMAPVLQADLTADEPWQLREQPSGERLDVWLDRLAPLTDDQTARLGERLAELLHRIHRAGGLVRNLTPKHLYVA